MRTSVLVAELRLRGIRTEARVPLRVRYKFEDAGEHYIEILMGSKLVLSDEHLAQTLNYLKGAGNSVALLNNFQHPKVEWRRIVHNF